MNKTKDQALRLSKGTGWEGHKHLSAFKGRVRPALVGHTVPLSPRIIKGPRVGGRDLEQNSSRGWETRDSPGAVFHAGGPEEPHSWPLSCPPRATRPSCDASWLLGPPEIGFSQGRGHSFNDAQRPWESNVTEKHHIQSRPAGAANLAKGGPTCHRFGGLQGEELNGSPQPKREPGRWAGGLALVEGTLLQTGQQNQN